MNYKTTYPTRDNAQNYMYLLYKGSSPTTFDFLYLVPIIDYQVHIYSSNFYISTAEGENKIHVLK